MITLESFVLAIQDAVLRANEALMSRNAASVLDEFFEPAPAQAGPGVAGGRRPKIVVVQYPRVVDGEITMKEVHVPLLTIVPLTFSAIGEVTLTTDLTIQQEGDQLLVNFDKPRQSPLAFRSKTSGHAGHLEITIRPGESAEGLKVLVDGYERALRAQIPG